VIVNFLIDLWAQTGLTARETVPVKERLHNIAGRLAAIPAVVIYNIFSRGIAGYRALCADGAAEILRIASRDLDRAESGQASPCRRPQAAE